MIFSQFKLSQLTIKSFVCFSLCVGCLGLLSLQGCSTTGNQKLKDQDQSSIEQKIVVGTSSLQNVVDEFGTPYSAIKTDSGSQIWIYRYQHGKPWVRNFVPIYNLFDSGTDLEITELIVSFDNSNIAKKVEIRKIQDISKRGITVE